MNHGLFLGFVVLSLMGMAYAGHVDGKIKPFNVVRYENKEIKDAWGRYCRRYNLEREIHDNLKDVDSDIMCYRYREMRP